MIDYHLYLVEHPAGDFIGVAENEDTARACWGTLAKITPMSPYDVITMRAKGIPERVFLAI